MTDAMDTSEPTPTQTHPRLSVASLLSDAPGPDAASTSTANLPIKAPHQLTIDTQDEDVLIAVKALGDMKRSRGRPSPGLSLNTAAAASGQPTPSLTNASSSASPSEGRFPLAMTEDTTPPDFVSRVSGFPIVNTALRAYEQSKASSRVVKYGAEMVESSVKTISKPVINRLPVNQLDEFACRQLDRFGYGRSGTERADENMLLDERERSQERGKWAEEKSKAREQPLVLSSRETSVAPSSADDSFSESEGPTTLPSPAPAAEDPEQQQQVATRSKWQAMLLEAGGIGAAVSEESMKRLKYCLQWLQYATAHIDQKIIVLQEFIASLKDSPQGPDAVISANALRTLNEVKRDVVDTIRQVVDVVGQYAGGALPEPARASVRSFILHLPQRWATANQQQRSQATNNPTPASSPSATPYNSRYYRPRAVVGGGLVSSPTEPSTSSTPPPVQSVGPPTAGAAEQAAVRILTLATESLEMMRSVTGVFKDSLDRAEAWVERLRVVGIQRQQQGVHDPSSPSASLQSLSLAAAYMSAPTTPGGSASSSRSYSFNQGYLPTPGPESDRDVDGASDVDTETEEYSGTAADKRARPTITLRRRAARAERDDKDSPGPGMDIDG